MIRKLFWGKKLPRKYVFAVGLYTITYPIYDMLYAPVVHSFREPIDLKKEYGEGTLAVVTGATSETGKAYAKSLQEKGFKLVLVDEDEKSVKDMAQAMGATPFCFPFKTETNWEEYESLCKKIQELGEVSLLVNNVEMWDKGKGKVHKSSDADLLEVINSNTFPVVFMTRFLGPQMKQRKHKSAIINMGSIYHDKEISKAPVFVAGKGFTDAFSQVVGYENQDMDVLTVHGMPTKSKRNPNGVDADELVEGVMMDLGHERISYGHWQHSLFRQWILVR